ncbi:NADP-dependent oxidoreductase [Rhizobium halophytocola]|uniref:NADPH:quinone reductase-like Zn-dependent oxidoreductase n=1 Tax=Rhizobium halophytocola TaxID=735519 RepID=A0ABS4DV79_9HYPH|nr:NADP-dependent oxidoreductase [Rhizobium halophytocola]MBP1849602.1 NADPH:quinone reductase-like Zn-dependent oxidoreductase [Rhizobium halophytocola]
MRACFYESYGGPDVLQFGDLPDPEPAEGEVLVALEAASVAPLDWKLRAGELSAHFTPHFPKIPGRDGTGTVVGCGEGVTRFKPGDRVCVMAPPMPSAGTYAQRIASAEALVVLLPDALSMQQGAAIINAGLSAWISAVVTADVKPGQKVLVHGGSGAVGGILVQLCRHLGAEVTATCRSTNVDYVRSLGAGKAIAYDREDFTELQQQDVVFDLMGGEVHDRSYRVLKPGGHLVWLTALPIADRGAVFGVTVTRAMISDNAGAVSSIMALSADGVIRPQIADVLPLERAAEAQRMMEDGRVTRGRLILEI